MEGDVNDGDEVVGASRQFGVGRDVAAAAATLGVVEAGEANAGIGRIQPRPSDSLADPRRRWQLARFGLHGFQGCRADDPLMFGQVNFTSLPAIILIVWVIHISGNVRQIYDDGRHLFRAGSRLRIGIVVARPHGSK